MPIMPLFQSLFRPSKPKTNRPPRRAWPRLHRSKGTTVPPDSEDNAALTTDAAQQDQPVSDEKHGAARSHEEEESLDDNAHAAQATPAGHEQQPSADSGPARKSHDSSELARSQHGSKRLKNFVNRLRGSKSQDGGSLLSLSDALQQTEPGESKSMNAHENENTDDIQDSNTNPVDTETKREIAKDDKENVPSRVPSAVARESNEQHRNVSAQTTCSQASKATVQRHPSQRIPMPTQDPQDDGYWSRLLNFELEATHRPEPSDPFSDGKTIETTPLAGAPSHCSKQSSKRQSRASEEPCGQRQTEISRRPSSKTTASSCQGSGQRISSNGSRASRSSLLSRLDPSKAAMAFNVLATRLNVQLSIPTDEVTAAALDEQTTPEGDSTARPRNRLLQRVRPVQSNLNLEADSQPAPKLRRTKTFANFARRPSPMTSLRGKSIETLARLGGHSFLVLPAELAPFPLQLPACIVATVMYLRKGASSGSDLFDEPGDIKAATTLYDHFASQVLAAEKDEPKIALTMRVIAMPHWETETQAGVMLSVGWTLKALLAGLPGGILGSVRLYETLAAIYFVETPIPTRTRFITLAIVALTSEMQRALICAVFGLLTGLLQQEPKSTNGGNALRPMASLTEADRLARVFGPLLLGTGTKREGGEDKVEREVEEQRVAGLLLEHWPSVNRQLRECSGQ